MCIIVIYRWLSIDLNVIFTTKNVKERLVYIKLLFTNLYLFTHILKLVKYEKMANWTLKFFEEKLIIILHICNAQHISRLTLIRETFKISKREFMKNTVSLGFDDRSQEYEQHLQTQVPIWELDVLFAQDFWASKKL